MKKQSQLKASTEKTAAQKKKADEEEELDVDALLEDLKQNMINVYGYLPASGGKDLQELQGKEATNILHEIELDINNNIKTIKYIFEKPDPNDKRNLKPDDKDF